MLLGDVVDVKIRLWSLRVEMLRLAMCLDEVLST